MNQQARSYRYRLALATTFVIITVANTTHAVAGQLSVDDFKFDGPLGSQGATIDKVGKNHFTVCLGHAPKQPTWGGQVEPILLPGPEVGSTVGRWEDFREWLLKNDPKQLVEPLKTGDMPSGAITTWNEGPHVQFGISNVLCEGSGNWTSNEDCLEAGAVLMKSISENYRETKPLPRD